METTSITFVEAISRVHKALLKDLRRLEEQVASGSEDVLPIVIARLERTQNHLAEHFRYEEQDGYMDGVRKREPRLERAIEQLGSEHRLILHSLESILEEARLASALDSALQEKILAWMELVREHERREDELIENAFNLDINAED
jgi:hypothetical protein